MLTQRLLISEIAGILVLIVFIASLFFSQGSITGYLTSNIERHAVDIVVDTSTSYVMTLKNNRVLALTSLSISGEVKGSGRVAVFLDNGIGLRRLVYANNKGASAPTELTAQFVDNDHENRGLVVEKYRVLEDSVPMAPSDLTHGLFRKVCSETCLLDVGLFRSSRYELLIFVDPGTTLKINEIAYTEVVE